MFFMDIMKFDLKKMNSKLTKIFYVEFFDLPTFSTKY